MTIEKAIEIFKEHQRTSLKNQFQSSAYFLSIIFVPIP